MDPEPSIRANTTVLLGNIAELLGEAYCKKVGAWEGPQQSCVLVNVPVQARGVPPKPKPKPKRKAEAKPSQPPILVPVCTPQRS
jgi:hypothetical protein